MGLGHQHRIGVQGKNSPLSPSLMGTSAELPLLG